MPAPLKNPVELLRGKQIQWEEELGCICKGWKGCVKWPEGRPQEVQREVLHDGGGGLQDCGHQDDLCLSAQSRQTHPGGLVFTKEI